MRIVLLLVVIANLLFFGWSRLDNAAAGEGARLANQVQPDKIKLLTPQQVAALGPAKVAALADVCIEWGPLSDAERTKALAELDSLQLGKLLTQRKVEVEGGFNVNIGPFPSRAAADKRVGELRAQSIGDLAVIDGRNGQFIVSLGIFRTEPAAQARVDALALKGLRAARVEKRTQPFSQTMFVVRDPQQPAVVRMKELQLQYPGSELKVGSCPAPS